MADKTYTVQMEVAGPLAMFARPDTGGTPTSYAVPTYSASKGILEAVAWLKSGARFNPTRIEVCKRCDTPGGDVKYQRYTTNYGGPLRKADQIRGGNNFQLIATVLADVCYRIHAEVLDDGVRPRNGINSRHYLKDLFERRLRQGRCHRTPCLGWSEFTASYWGKFREEYEIDTELNLEIPSMLVEVWDQPIRGSYSPTFTQEVRIDKGVLSFAQ